MQPLNNRLVIALLCLCLALHLCLAIDFCNIKACEERPHIGCNNNMSFHSSCYKQHRLVNIVPFTDYLVKIHNKYRQDVAAGRLPQLAPAQHLPEFVWHDYLALIAEYHVKRCLQQLSQFCLATSHFPAPQLNFAQALQSGSAQPISNVQYITTLTEEWLHQVYSLPRNDVSNYPSPRSEFKQIINVLNERTAYMGCAAAHDGDLRHSRFTLICYYSAAPEQGHPLYKEGTFSENGCQYGRSRSYNNLCQTLPLTD